MSIEIERRYLVDTSKLKAFAPHIRKYGTSGDTFVTRIEQVYLAASTRGSIRVRHSHCQWADRPQQWTLCIKGPGTLRRTEITLPIEKAVAEQLWGMTDLKVVKTRTEYEIDGRIWEVDEFSGPLQGLVLAEIEFKSETEITEITPPAFCVKEVTEDTRFNNARLAQLAAETIGHVRGILDLA